MLQVLDKKSGIWKQVSSSQVIVPEYTVTFRVPEWDTDVSHDYRVLYYIYDGDESRIPHYYFGVIVKDPAEKDEIVEGGRIRLLESVLERTGWGARRQVVCPSGEPHSSS